MNSYVMPSRVQMEPEVLKHLVREVKETVATGINVPKKSKRSFGIVDMWNIQKNRRFSNRVSR